MERGWRTRNNSLVRHCARCDAASSANQFTVAGERIIDVPWVVETPHDDLCCRVGVCPIVPFRRRHKEPQGMEQRQWWRVIDEFVEQ